MYEVETDGELCSTVLQSDTIETVTSRHLNRLMPHVSQKFLRLGVTQKPGLNCMKPLSYLHRCASENSST